MTKFVSELEDVVVKDVDGIWNKLGAPVVEDAAVSEELRVVRDGGSDAEHEEEQGDQYEAAGM